jgi:hypothetical protein
LRKIPGLNREGFYEASNHCSRRNGLRVQCLSERDFLFPDADEVYTPEVLAYVHRQDLKRFEAMLWKQSPEEVAASFSYLSARETGFLLRALFDQWTHIC